MDDIKFKIQKEKDGKFFNVLLFLNGEKISNHIFNTFGVLPLMKLNDEEFDLYTCTCGVPGCAGFHEPILHKTNKNKVFWYFSDDYNVEKKLYIFNKSLFNRKILELTNKVAELEKQNIFSMCSYDSISMDANNELKNDFCMFEYIKEKEDEGRIKEQFKKIIDENMPFFQYVNISYNGFTAKYKKEELILMILNESFRYKKSIQKKNKFFKDVANCCEAVMEFIINKRADKIIEIEKNIWEKSDKEELVYPIVFLGRVFFQKEKERMLFEPNGININGEVKPYPNNFSINGKFYEETVQFSVE